ncbi:MAG: mechanosensitive ion channel [Victivallales bacterium]|nr:mechanosensitive ion channel [Victivallales bacterium]
MEERVKDLLRPFLDHVPQVVGAIVIFVVGWLICKIISGCVSMMLRRVGIDEKLNKKNTQTPVRIEPIISKFVYYLLLIYVLLLTLDILGVRSVLSPIEAMLGKFLVMVPHIIGAAFIVFLGYILGKTLGGVVQAATSGFDSVVSKAGISDKLTVSKLLGQLVFIFVFVPIVVAALHVLQIEAISAPAIGMLEGFATAIPNIVGAGVCLIVFYVVGRLVTGFIAELLKNFGSDDIPKKIGASGLFGKRSFSIFCANIAFFFIMIFGASIAVSTLKMPEITEILTGLLVFSGKVVLGMIILGIGNFLATFAHDSLAKSTKGGVYPVIVRVAVLSLVLAMGLHTMGIAEDIVEMAFMFIFGTLGLTIVLAFGLGGREAAGKTMAKWLSKFN